MNDPVREGLDVMRQRWFARPNDLIGGWCVMPVDEPPSQGAYEVADFTNEAVARHIANLHNEWLGLENAA